MNRRQILSAPAALALRRARGGRREERHHNANPPPEPAPHLDDCDELERLPRNHLRGVLARRHHWHWRRRSHHPVQGERCRRLQKAIEAARSWLEAADPWQFSKILSQALTKIDGDWAAKAAIDIALLDWVSQKMGVPLWRYFGLDRNDAPVTTFSIGIDKAEVIKQKVREAEAFPVLKIKVGLDNDEEVIDAVRSVTKKPLRVDANEGFKSKEAAVEKINWLEKQGVEFIEQPLPAANLDDMNWIRKRVHMPIIADEACLHPRDIPRLAPHFDGVNIKVDKCGGLMEAWRMIQIARSLGLKVMMGCMVSSSVAISGAAQLSPLIDYADLDGHLLISNDPYEGVKVVNGRIVLSDKPGLGLKARTS